MRLTPNTDMNLSPKATGDRVHHDIPHHPTRCQSSFRALLANTGKEPVINLTAFLGTCALGLLQLGIIFHVREALNASPAVIGWLATIWIPGYVAGCLFIEPRLRRFPPRLPVLWATLTMGLTFGWMSITDSVSVLMSLSALYGVLLSLFWPFLMGWASSGHEGKSLGRTMAAYNLSWCSANIISLFFCGWLSERNTKWPLWGAAGLMLVAAILLRVASRIFPRIQSGQDHRTPSAGEVARPTSGRRTRLRFAAWTGLTVMCFGLGVILAVFPVSARQDLGFSMFLVGNLMLVRSAFQGLSFMALGKTERWHFRATPMLAGQCLGAAGFLGLMFATGRYSVGLCLSACGVATALSIVYSMFHGVSGTSNRSQAMAIHEMVLSLGLWLGGVLGGMIYQSVGMRTVYALCLGVFLVALPVQIVIARWARRTEDQSAGDAWFQKQN